MLILWWCYLSSVVFEDYRWIYWISISVKSFSNGGRNFLTIVDLRQFIYIKSHSPTVHRKRSFPRSTRFIWAFRGTRNSVSSFIAQNWKMRLIAIWCIEWYFPSMMIYSSFWFDLLKMTVVFSSTINAVMIDEK
jgi:hypothetical protein